MKLIFALSLIGASLTNTQAFTCPTSANSKARLQTHLKAEQTDAERVVVTGLGVVSGCGIGHEDFFQSCLDGKSSLGTVTRFDPEHYPCKIGSEVPDDMFVATDHFDNAKNVKSNDRFTHFAVAAARMALKDAGVGDTPDTLETPEKIGVMVGTAFGGVETFERETLKLAKKPERPKVTLFEASNCAKMIVIFLHSFFSFR
jgi:3-oxoacyl-[acyl-carrier-protein] synthase II